MSGLSIKTLFVCFKKQITEVVLGGLCTAMGKTLANATIQTVHIVLLQIFKLKVPASVLIVLVFCL